MKLWCTSDYKTAKSVQPSAFGTSCAGGKWCENGKCVTNNLAPVGACLLNDNKEFCTEFRMKFGLQNTCLNFKTTRCCEMCGGQYIGHTFNHTIKNWLSKAMLKNVEILSNNQTEAFCGNKYDWCENLKNQKKDENICNKFQLVNNEIFKFVCRKTCDLC